MAKIETVQQAKDAISREAVQRATNYLEVVAPETLNAVTFLVNEQKWSAEDVMREFDEPLDETEEKTQHKLKIVVKALVRERDNDA